MIYLLGGCAVLKDILLLIYLFINADPARLARGLKVTGIVIAVPTVATPFLRMNLDHDTGSMEGTILRGRFAGMRLEELAPADLLALLRECRAEDEEGARLLEAYLDRVRPDWRDELAGERTAGAGRGNARPTSGDMSVEEAYAILGLSSGADADAIKEAHRRLMVKLHPDHGGSDYLATKINRARDVLLHR